MVDIGSNRNSEEFYNIGDSNLNNTFANNLNYYSELNTQLSTIQKDSTDQITFAKTLKDMLNDIKIPYPNKDEIPLIKIKDENYFENGQSIENYIKSLSKFDDNKFNICKQCKKIKNKYFCKNCNQNICDNKCDKNCLDKNHYLIKLEKYEKDIEKKKNDINLIISNYFISPKEKQISEGIEKKNKNYDEIIDENEINEIEQKLMEYTNDIILIESIIEKNYINHFHYTNIKECFNYIEKKFNDSIIIYYKIRKNDAKIKIFGQKFVKNNENNCHIIYKNKKYELMEFLELEKLEKLKILEIKLIGISKIKDASYMFYECESLISLPNINIWNTNNIINMSWMFRGCISLKSLPDISNWNTNNIADMSWMFSLCKSLISLPDISNWNTNNATNMSYIFNLCISLKSLPDISKWNTNKVKNMNGMFDACESLISLPDISKWNTNNVTNIIWLFSKCKSLQSLPDISNWKINNVKDVSCMFDDCISLISLPDISKWNINRIKLRSNMFRGCKSLKSLPNMVHNAKINNL